MQIPVRPDSETRPLTAEEIAAMKEREHALMLTEAQRTAQEKQRAAIDLKRQVHPGGSLLNVGLGKAWSTGPAAWSGGRADGCQCGSSMCVGMAVRSHAWLFQQPPTPSPCPFFKLHGTVLEFSGVEHPPAGCITPRPHSHPHASVTGCAERRCTVRRCAVQAELLEVETQNLLAEASQEKMKVDQHLQKKETVEQVDVWEGGGGVGVGGRGEAGCVHPERGCGGRQTQVRTCIAKEFGSWGQEGAVFAGTRGEGCPRSQHSVHSTRTPLPTRVTWVEAGLQTPPRHGSPDAEGAHRIWKGLT